jgi:hypothetical protein
LENSVWATIKELEISRNISKRWSTVRIFKVHHASKQLDRSWETTTRWSMKMTWTTLSILIKPLLISYRMMYKDIENKISNMNVSKFCTHGLMI